MNPYTGATYPSLAEALKAGEKPEDIVEVSGPPEAVERAVRSVQDGAKAKAKRKAQRAARKRNR